MHHRCARSWSLGGGHKTLGLGGGHKNWGHGGVRGGSVLEKITVEKRKVVIYTRAKKIFCWPKFFGHLNFVTFATTYPQTAMHARAPKIFLNCYLNHFSYYKETAMGAQCTVNFLELPPKLTLTKTKIRTPLTVRFFWHLNCVTFATTLRVMRGSAPKFFLNCYLLSLLLLQTNVLEYFLDYQLKSLLLL